MEDEQNPRCDMDIVYEYCARGKEKFCTIAERSFILDFFEASEFVDLFQGAFGCGCSSGYYMGVIGKRNGARLRRVLRERGANFKFVHECPKYVLELSRQFYGRRPSPPFIKE